MLSISGRFLRNAVAIGCRAVPSSYCHTQTGASSTAQEAESDAPVRMKNPFQKERPVCLLCKHNITPDYKTVQLLSQFQSPYTGRIYGKHITGLCQLRQEQVEREIKKAQYLGIMGTYHKSLEYLKDPKLFDPERPLRPHKY